MSDTTSTTPKLPPLPNYSLTTEMRGPPEKQVEYLTAKFGNPVRSVSVKPLTMGEQWDLSEITPPNAHENWLNMGQIAYAVKFVDGAPVRPFDGDRKSLRDRLDMLGVDGLRAASMALNRVFDQSATPDAAPTPDTVKPQSATDPALMATAKN